MHSVITITRQVHFQAPCCTACQSLLQKWTQASREKSTAVVDIPVIKVPKRLEKKVALTRKVRKDRGQFQWQGRVFNSRPGKEILSAKRKEFNYYQNQIYETKAPVKLASQGWKHKKSVGDHFTLLAHRGNPSIYDPDLEEKANLQFSKYNLDDRLLTELEDINIVTPTIIQDIAIPVLMKGRNTLFAAETGSGKTLAYLLPILDSLLKQRDKYDGGDVASPRAVILLPARELAQQVHIVAEHLTKNYGINSELLDRVSNSDLDKENLERPIDLLVATSGKIIKAVKNGLISLRSVRHTVIDETDTLLDDSFKSSTLHILKKMEISQTPVSPLGSGPGSQLILSGATMPKQAITALEDVLSENSLDVISTPHLHRVQPHVTQRFMRLHSKDKAVTLLQLLGKDVRTKTAVMVFCNETSTCNWLAYVLEENGIDCLRLNGDMKTKDRRGVMEAFQSGSCDILVSTDIASRGIDTHRVEHIINFDFPTFMSDYIHRVGRVGRVSSKAGGRVSSFVIHKWDVDLVNKIESAVRNRESLPRVDANIKRKHVLRNTDSTPFNQLLFE
ncbi:probable ATP-dependent RNA helicase DDX28 isoform X1 [Apostichopus japonicus]|uniref:probable ATP-dependent RNA helicase DDX28 isoform X1 n=1 Tax=Stichopus japonicus TaxID=307972 RepID=UPI003AB77BCA